MFPGASPTWSVTPGTHTLDGGPLNGQYELVQFHIHFAADMKHGCEHTIDDKPHPAEVNICWYAFCYYKLGVWCWFWYVHDCKVVFIYFILLPNCLMIIAGVLYPGRPFYGLTSYLVIFCSFRFILCTTRSHMVHSQRLSNTVMGWRWWGLSLM